MNDYLKNFNVHLCFNIYNMKAKFNQFVFLISLISVLFIGQKVKSQIVAFPVKQQNTAKLDGIFYYLPRNVIKVDVCIVSTIKTKGPYADYADKFLGMKNVVKGNSTTYEINDIKLNSYAEPDSAQIYQVKALPTKNKPFVLSFNEDGTLLNCNQSLNDKPQQKKKQANNSDLTGFSAFSDFVSPNEFEKIDTIVRKTNIDTITIEEKFYKRTVSEKPLEQKAREAADAILKLEENRYNLVTGSSEVNYEKGSIEYMDNQMKIMEDEYLLLFQGNTQHKFLNYSFTFLPEINNEGKNVNLFKFSNQKGITELSDKEGNFVSVFSESMKITENIQGAENKDKKSKNEEYGLYYRFPEKVRFDINYLGKSIESDEFPISQFGKIGCLPAEGVSSVEFYPQTGALKTILFNK